MITLMSAIRRRPGMTPAEFRDYLQFTHGEIARANPLALSAYRQNFVTVSQAGSAVVADRDNITELDFAGLPQLFATMGHEYSRTVVGPDGVNFSDLPVASAMLVSVEPLAGGSAEGSGGSGGSEGGAHTKAIALLGGSIRAADSGRWDAAHATLVDAGHRPTASVTLHRRMPEGDELVGYFGGADAERYSAAITLEGRDDALELLSAYVAAIADVDPALVDPDRVIVCAVDVVRIL